MKKRVKFQGFSQGFLGFFEGLERHNDRDWFNAHRSDFQHYVIEPAVQLVMEIGERLQFLAPNIVADPRVNKSIFRLNRDTRFSSNKTPYKTHLGVYWWEGHAKKLECPGFYFHLEPSRLLIGGGIYMFTKPLLQVYRESVAHEKYGTQLQGILEQTMKDFPSSIQSDRYKRVPHGYSADHPRADLLKYKGMTIGEETPVPEVIFTPKCVDYVYQRFSKMITLHRWLLAMTKRVEPNTYNN